MKRIVLASLLLSVGCGHYNLAKQFRRLHPDCRDGDVESMRRGDEEVFLLRGCGIEDTAYRACGGNRCVFHFQSVVLRRAAFATSCPEEQLVVTTLSPNEIGVEGCGVREVYQASVEGWIPRSEPERVPVR
ncbi:MAG: hypothetical protein RLO52_03870 [Sandaracinaceae bacterium]|nr:MAG: hypothetical protein EVA89_22880 [Sandaracinaceae bacterium]